MFSLIKNISGYLWGGNTSSVTTEEEKITPEEFDSLVSYLQSESEEERRIVKDTGFNYINGKISYKSEEYCLIDGKYYLDLRKFKSREALEVGTPVSVSVFRLSEEDEWQISKVYSYGEEIWDEEIPEEIIGVKKILAEDEGRVMNLNEAEKTGLAQWRTVVAKVEQRSGRDVIVEPGDIRFSLDDVESNVIPYIGDWLSLEAMVEIDEESGDLGGNLLKVQRVSPLRVRLVERGKVTRIEGPCAIINGNILAHQLSFSPGYEPTVGDIVVLQAIESDCGAGCAWRALALAPAIMSLQKKVADTKVTDTEEDDILTNDKEGITVSGNVDFGNMNIGDHKSLILNVQNVGDSPKWLIRAKFHGPKAQSQMIVSLMDAYGGGIPLNNKPIPVYPGRSLSFEFKCHPKFLGSSSELFIFTFRGFRIGRRLQVRVSNSNLRDGWGEETYGMDLYKGGGKNSRWNRSRRPNDREAVIVPGVRPHKAPAFVSMKLPIYNVPDQLWDAVVGPDGTSQLNKRSFLSVIKDVTDVAPALDPLDTNGISLCPKNYKARFHALLHLEEIEMSIRMMERDMIGITLQEAGPGGQFLSLEVPGLAEKRPSIIVGDRVLLSSSTTVHSNDLYQQGTKYEGFVHKILKSDVWLKFNGGFHETYKQLYYESMLNPEAPNMAWDVSFHFSRTPLRRCHLGVDLALSHLGEQFLFPMQIIKKKPQVFLLEETGSVENQNMQLEGDKSTHLKADSESDKFGNLNGLCSNKMVDRVEGTEKSSLELNVGSGRNAFPLQRGVLGSNIPADVSCDAVHSSQSSREIPETRIKANGISDGGITNGVADDNKVGKEYPKGASPRIPVAARLFGIESPPKSVKTEEKICDSAPAKTVISDNLVFESGGKLSSAIDDCVSILNHQKRKLQWYNKKLNYQQKQAVMNILKGEARPLPYVIFGPPGTGKTVTLVEAILQTLHLIPESRILVASPSNSSANLIAERILQSVPLNPGELVRLIAIHCLEKGNIPSRLMPYCTTGVSGRMASDENEVLNFDDGEKKLRLPMSSSSLGRHRITIGTCVTLGQIHALGFPQGHFTHIFLDEAGQATEPEALIPLGFLSTSAEIGWGQAVFAGDPRQLGPVVLSRLAHHLGLGISLLDRMLSSSPYAPDPTGFPNVSGHYNPSVVTRLVMNYRSVPDLLSLTSEMFYDSSLKPTVSPYCGKEGVLLLRLGEHLPLMKCHPSLSDVKIASPLIFHGVRGEECRHPESPSWYNPMEALQCLEYIKILYHLGGLEPEDIGIITPYIEQVKAIRNLIADHCLPPPTVGTVEELQGQERLAIIMSTVRTSRTFINIDLLHALGFVSSPNRLNVATSRARALLIVIGDPHLLNHDPLWKKLIQRCVENNSYVGSNLPSSFCGKLDDADIEEVEEE
ncbi:probable RNA helicase armi [Ischnura elegans]|uniref:probable RNA helicase armi n=1 Tax=Ischnura elegans TaxID=197161 RepID=UPI001ED8AF82|nr:probable RNA helicase armi [Ischnura elegans]